MIGRREFITLLGGAAATWPLAARAQQPPKPVVGFLSIRSSGESTATVNAFLKGARELGYVEGQNFAVDFRWAEGDYARLPDFATDLVRRQVSVIVAAAGLPGIRAVQAATATIPTVFQTGVDPVQAGLVASLNRPGGNITGVTTLGNEVAAKRLELLHELIPAAKDIALLVNPANPNASTSSRDLQAAAQTLRLKLNPHILHASTDPDIDAVFANLSRQKIAALVISNDAFFVTRSPKLGALTSSHGVPAIFYTREFAAAGGMMSYGGSLADSYRLVGIYAARILNGERPVDLPVQQATKVELILNLRTAKALGLTVPLSLLARADEVIE